MARPIMPPLLSPHPLRPVARCFLPRRLAVPAASARPVAAPSAPPTSSAWAQFASRVSGEWDGYGADFSCDGKPFQLPDAVVPEAFREWGVAVVEWQTQCPTLADPSGPHLSYKLIKLLPTVGCEADAATRYETVERNASSALAFAYSPEGCYVAAWPAAEEGVLELEHCLIHPDNEQERLRVVQVVRRRGDAACLAGARMFTEHWEGPFCNGEQLGGCGGWGAGFTSAPALPVSQISGLWESDEVATAKFSNSSSKVIACVLSVDGPQKLIRTPQGIVPLPKQVWLSESSQGDEHFLEVGWLLQPGKALTSRCIISSQEWKVQEISLASEAPAQKSS